VNNKVVVRGNFSFSSTVDLSSLNKKLILEGDGATFTFNCPRGILLGSNVVLRNIDFTYVPGSLTYTPNDFVNTGNGCIYASGSVNILDSAIENCTFTHNSTTQRPPFINLELHTNQVVNGLQIAGNKFSDVSPASTLGRRQAAIALIFTNDGLSTNPALVMNTVIERNTVNYNQGIYLTTVLSGGTTVPRPGINCVNTHVRNNNCGVIGFITSSVLNNNTVLVISANPLGLTVSGNNCHYIASLYSTGQHIATLVPPFTYGFGNVVVENNFCNWIHVVSQDYSASSETSSLVVSKNSLQGYDNTYLSGHVGGSTTFNYAILTFAYPSAGDASTCRIVDNNINYGKIGATTYLYIGGIWALGSALIRGNIIRGFARGSAGNFEDGIGIIAKGFAVGTGDRNYVITNNEIYREGNLINAYISSDAGLPGSGIVRDNFFDKTTTDGTETLLHIFPYPVTWIVEGNINHTTFMEIKGWVGTLTINDVAMSGTALNSQMEARNATLVNTADRTVRFFYNDVTFQEYGRWRIPLNGLLPAGVEIVSVLTSIDSNSTPSSGGLSHLKIMNDLIFEQVTAPIDATDHLLTLTPTNTFRNLTTNPVTIEVEAKVQSAFAVQVYIDRVTVIYRW
jgi:hypothetical protein